MTLILAAKNVEGIVIAYDTAGVKKRWKKQPDGSKEGSVSINHIHKVYPLTSNIVYGVAGDAMFSYVKGEVQELSEVGNVHELAKAIALRGDLNSHGSITLGHLLGGFQDDKFSLLTIIDGKIQYSDRATLGIGAYPEVMNKIDAEYHPTMSTADISQLFKESIALAGELAKSEPQIYKRHIEGLGIGVLKKEGYTLLESTIQDGSNS